MFHNSLTRANPYLHTTLNVNLIHKPNEMIQSLMIKTQSNITFMPDNSEKFI